MKVTIFCKDPTSGVSINESLLQSQEARHFARRLPSIVGRFWQGRDKTHESTDGFPEGEATLDLVIVAMLAYKTFHMKTWGFMGGGGCLQSPETDGFQNCKLLGLGTINTRNFGAPAILVPVWVVLWHPKGYQNRWFSKWQVLGTFRICNFGAPAILVSVGCFRSLHVVPLCLLVVAGQVCAIIAGLVVANNFDLARRPLMEHSFAENQKFFRAVFEIGRRPGLQPS